MIKLVDGEETDNLIVDANIILNIFCNGFANVFRRFGGEKVNHYNAKCSGDQNETQESQNHCSDNFSQLILLLNPGNGGNYRKKYQRNYRNKKEIEKNIANGFQVDHKIRCENPDHTADENPD